MGKLTDLTPLEELAVNDVVHIVDVSDTTDDVAGSSFKVTIQVLISFVVAQITSLFATQAQGALADSALQSGDNISALANDVGYMTSDDRTAAQVTVTPAGTISSTNVQAALEELDQAIQTIGPGGGSLSKETPTGAINNVNTTFNVATEPFYINVNGAIYEEGDGEYVSFAAGVITLANPVATGGFIKSYHY